MIFIGVGFIMSSDRVNAGTNNSSELLRLAKEKFGNLTKAEEKLFQGIANGAVADYSAQDANDNDPADANNWGPDRIIKADRIAWLCTDKQASELVTHRGILVKGTLINGKLDLLFCMISFPLYFEKCAFEGDINLRKGRVSALYLNGTHTGPIIADGLQVDGDVFFENGFKAEGIVSIIGAKIGWNLQCANGQFINKGAAALNADMMKVEGSVLLGDGFRSEGEVRLVNATIGGVLACYNGQFINEDGKALNADSLKVGDNILLRTGFKARGKVSLIGARIGGNLDCYDGLFINREKVALDADAVKVEGSIFLRDGFKAEGEVRVVGARIGGDLACNNAQFINRGGIALSADSLKTEGRVFLHAGFKAEGEVRLVSANIGASLECDSGQFINPNGYGLNAAGLTVEGNVSLRDGFKAEGMVDFIGATIGGYFVWRNVASPTEVTLDLRSAKIGTLWDERESWPEKGKLFIHGLVYDEIHNTATRDAKSRIDWLRRQGAFWPQPYEKLAEVLQKSGHENDAKEILIAKNKDKARLTQLTWSELLWYRVFGPMIGYGYRPWRAFWIGIVIVLLGWLFFWAGYRAEVMTPAKEGADASGGFCALVYSLDVFVPLVDLRQANYCMPNANLTGEVSISDKLKLTVSGKYLRYYLWFEVIAGWILTTLLVVGLTGLVRT